MSRLSFLSAAALLGASLATPSFASSAPNSAWDAKSIYRQNLVDCIGRARTCDKARLSQDDRDYLTYEMKEQRFDKLVVQQVADVRMQIYGGPVPVIHGNATGPRYASGAPSAPAERSARSSNANSQVIGLTKLGLPEGLAQVGGMALDRLGTAMN
jgi:hypothetical protein